MRRNKILKICIGSAISCIFVGGPAHAALIDIVWTGTVVSGVDGAGLFHTGSLDLADQNFLAFYRFDTTLGRFSGTNSDQIISGGSSVPYYQIGPIILSSLSINSHQSNIANKYYSTYSRHHRQLVQLNTEVRGNFDGSVNQDFLNANFFGYGNLSVPLDSPYAKILTASDNPYGAFQKVDTKSGAITHGILRPSFVSIYLAPAAVPEPANWALATVAFGLMGSVLRLRRQEISRPAKFKGSVLNSDLQ